MCELLQCRSCWITKMHYWQATTFTECCSISRHRYMKVRPRSVMLVAWRVALAWHSGTRPLQAESNSALMSVWKGPQVPGRLLHTSLKHCQLTTSVLFQPTSPDSTTSPAQYSLSQVWWSGTYYQTLDSLCDQALSSDLFRQLLKTNLFRCYHWVGYIQCSRDASWLCAIEIHDWHWHWPIRY